MAIYIQTGSITKSKDSVIWTLRNRWPNVVIDEIVTFCAEGAELDLILNHVHNLPHTDHYIQVWFGDMAKFLYRAMLGLPGVLVANPAKHQP